MVSALQHHRIVCGMTTQPTVTAIEKKGVGYSAIDLATTAGVQHWLGGFQPTAGVLARADWVNQNKATVQKVVNALVATMHYIATHSAAEIADAPARGLRLELADHQGRLHPRPDHGQGPVPARRDDAGQRPADGATRSRSWRARSPAR